MLLCTNTLEMEHVIFGKKGQRYRFNVSACDLYVYGENGQILQIQHWQKNQWFLSHFQFEISLKKIS